MNPTTPTDLPTLKQNAYDASSSVADLTASAPSMLQQLKQNLVGIFSNNNPIMAARDSAAQDYLGEANKTRADLLPSSGNLPVINGRQTVLSPTQQQAIVDSHLAAALTPLVGYNNQITGEYGTISDLVKNAGDTYGSAITGAQQHASNLLDLYKTAVSELQARNSAPYNAMGDPTIQALLKAFLNPQQNRPGQSLDDIFALPTKKASQIPAQNAQIPAPQGLGAGGQSATLSNPFIGPVKPIPQPGFTTGGGFVPFTL